MFGKLLHLCERKKTESAKVRKRKTVKEIRHEKTELEGYFTRIDLL